ncbi:hypothetical protein PV04_09841 [Phialophora macrospora]|uniref:NADP-dependent oxidoreductase domain-containing protein n=1 Tax=Phialophora macrospora TaxID=1851006 RepID=A0A0D2CD13_9EURO|nr:hypothetical protein PV04_09841 [Phialophora macrospora]
MATTTPNFVFGGGSITSDGGYSNVGAVEELLDVLEREGIKQIDTAQLYGNGTSEELLGEAKAGSRFLIDTKHVGGWIPGNSSREQVVERGHESLRRLGAKKVNIFYIHAPDPKFPLEETLAGINDLYRAGTFDRFGLSNFTAAEVEEAIRIAKEKDFVVPSVYQGNYNAVARRTETELFPVLRKHGMAFYAYSPMAGGFLTKTREKLSQSSGGEGRWSRETAFGQLYHALYNKPSLLEALDIWNEISETSKIPTAELAYRWIAYHSHLDGKSGDAVVIGASRITQLEQTLAALRRGPLPEAVQKRIAGIWEMVKHESILDSYDTLRVSN